MKRIANYFLFFTSLLIIGTLFTQCNEECFECEAARIQPSVSIRFLNQDSLTEVTALRNQTTTRINATNTLRNRYTDSVAAGNNSYVQLRDSVIAAIDSLQKKRAALEATMKKINDGFIKLGPVYGVGMSEPIYFKDERFKDSLRSFRFPLNPNTDSSRFIITIRDTTYLLQLSYFTKEFLDVNRIRIGAYNLQIDTSNFTKTTIRCRFTKPECPSDETDLVLSF